MAKDAEASLIIRLKDFASEQLDKLGKKIESVGESFEKSKYLFVAATGAMVAGIGIAVREFAQEELAVAGLTKALQNQGITNRAVVEDLKKYASALQQVSIYADEEIIAAQKQLVTFGLTGQELKNVTKAALDLAAAKGIDLVTASNLLGKAFAGETGTLSRYGIIVDDNASKSEKFAQALDIITSSMGGAAAAERETFIGQMTALKNAFSDFLELIGGVFAPIIGKAADLIRGVLEGVRELNPHISAAGVIIAVLVTSFLGLVTVIGGLVFTLWPALLAAFATIMGPIGAVALAIAGMGAVVFALRNIFDDLAKIAVESARTVLSAWGGVAEGFLMLIHGKFAEGWEKIKSASADAVNAIGEGLQATTDTVINEAERQYNAIVNLISRKQDLNEKDIANQKSAQAKRLKELDDYHQKIWERETKSKEFLKKLQLQADKDIEEQIKAHNAKEAELDQKKVELKQIVHSQIQFIAANTGKVGFYIGKALAIADSIVNTARGVTLALGTIPPPWSFGVAATVGALGAAQTGIIASQMVNFAEGGLVMPSAGGTIARIGEAGSREAVIPLDDPEAREGIRDALGGEGVIVNINAGVVVADDDAMRKFAKMIDAELYQLKKNRESVSL